MNAQGEDVVAGTRTPLPIEQLKAKDAASHKQLMDIREKLALFPNAALYPQLVSERGWDRGRLLWALERENLLPANVDNDPSLMPEMSTAAVAAVHAYLARSPSQLLVIQAEDLLGVLDQANLPGTQEDKHPNWQQRLPVDLEAWTSHERVQAVLAAVRQERP
jgi:(1->4)-alpha-D-glucan 1-alpha-D-glucosylmutase